MDIQYFPHFIRKNLPGIKGTNEEFIKIGEEFKTYLLEKFQGKEDKLEKIWDISPATVIMNQMNNPFHVNGYHAALILHFTQYIEEARKQIEKEE